MKRTSLICALLCLCLQATAHARPHRNYHPHSRCESWGMHVEEQASYTHTYKSRWTQRAAIRASHACSHPKRCEEQPSGCTHCCYPEVEWWVIEAVADANMMYSEELALTASATMSVTHPLYNVERWAILLDYDEIERPVPAEQVDCFDMIIYDADYHPPLSDLKASCVKFAYASLGEAESYRAYWDDIEGSPWILGSNQNWLENFVVDVRAQEWHDVILNQVIPGIVAQGFDGVFMDTLDTVDVLSYLDPANSAEYRQAMIDLVNEIHTQYPNLLLLSNNGYTILETIAPTLTAMVAEDLVYAIDWENGGYRSVRPSERRPKLQILRPLSSQYDMPVFAINYADEDNEQAQININYFIGRLQFYSYIAEAELDRIYSAGNLVCEP